MNFELESGRSIADVAEEDLLNSIPGEDFAILGASDETYLQCAAQHDPPCEYVLQYQDGSLAEHYRATDVPISLDRILTAFVRYLRNDESWRTDFQREQVEVQL